MPSLYFLELTMSTFLHVLYYSAVAAASLLFIYAGYLNFQTLNRSKTNRQIKKSPSIYISQQHGWGVVNPAALVLDRKYILSLTMPYNTSQMFGCLHPSTIYGLVRQFKITLREGEVVEDLLRGMTIGSALFNYSIPESFVLIDTRTRQLCALFLRGNEDKKTHASWRQEHPDLFTAQYALVTALETTKLSVTNRNAKLFYNRHYKVLVTALMAQAQLVHYPSIDAFMEIILVEMNVAIADLEETHYLRLTLSAVIDILDLEVPSSWVMVSEMGDVLNDWVQDIKPAVTEPIKSHLTLVQ